jgi:hypothetical protein
MSYADFVETPMKEFFDGFEGREKGYFNRGDMFYLPPLVLKYTQYYNDEELTIFSGESLEFWDGLRFTDEWRREVWQRKRFTGGIDRGWGDWDVYSLYSGGILIGDFDKEICFDYVKNIMRKIDLEKSLGISLAKTLSDRHNRPGDDPSILDEIPF